MDCMLYVVFGRNKALMPFNIESTISLVPIQMEVPLNDSEKNTLKDEKGYGIYSYRNVILL